MATVDVDFFGDNLSVTVTQNSKAVKDWIKNALENNRRLMTYPPFIVGLSFGGETNDSIATVNLCVGRRCLVFQIAKVVERRILSGRRQGRVPKTLKRFFSDDRIIFFCIKNSIRARFLERYGIRIENLKDSDEYHLGETYGEVISNSEINYGFELDEKVTKSTWTTPELDKAQIDQAAKDSYVVLKVGINAIDTERKKKNEEKKKKKEEEKKKKKEGKSG